MAYTRSKKALTQNPKIENLPYRGDGSSKLEKLPYKGEGGGLVKLATKASSSDKLMKTKTPLAKKALSRKATPISKNITATQLTERTATAKKKKY